MDLWVQRNDPLGGHDPYSSSKAAAEIAIESWRSSFCGALPHQTPHLRIASARAGNVIGGGDWAGSRIMPDVMSSQRRQTYRSAKPFCYSPLAARA